jgi:crotonobetainyl-CoA:carnitine CoA-transferase CaiB-like acyl-CoA transferase
MVEAALAGVKVLEYCEMVSGPYCAKLLADLGAEVIKIEKPGIGDEARRRGPFLNNIGHPERSGLFLYLNTSKRGITLNPETQTGKKLFKELVKGVDILVEDTTPGTMERLGLGYETLKEINPSLIMTSVTPYGQTGPYRGYKARHLNIYHVSGQAHFSYNVERLPGQPPVQGGGYIGDYDAGLSAGVATLAALYRRGFNGIGQHIDISREEALTSLDRVDIGAFANEGADTSKRRRRGMLGGVMPCRDGYVVIAAAQQQQWEGLVKLMGSPDWAKGEKCKDEFARSDNAAELQPLIEEWMLQHTKEEIYHGGQKFGCPAGPVNSAAGVFNSPQIKARGFFVEIDHPEAGKLSYPSASYKFSETPWQASRAAPLLGEHNREVYCQHLGYTEKQLAKMKGTGVI